MRTHNMDHASSSNDLGKAAHHASETLSRLAREAQVFGGGTISGAIESGYKRLSHDPAGVAVDAGKAVIAGAGIAVVAEAAPIVVAGFGLVAAGVLIYDNLSSSSHAERNATLASAWQNTWNSNDPRTMNYYAKKVARTLGPEAFDVALTTAFGAGSFGAVNAKLTSTAARITEGGFHRLGTTPQHCDQTLKSMQSYLGGELNAFQKGAIKLKSEPVYRYENATRQPRQESLPPMKDHVSHSSPKQYDSSRFRDVL